MDVQIRREGSVSVVDLTGEFEASTLERAAARIDALLEGGASEIVFDLRGLSFLDSSALGYLVRVHNRARAGGGAVVVALTQHALRNLFTTLGVDRRIAVFETAEDAVRHLAARARSAGRFAFAFLPPEESGPLAGSLLALTSDGLVFRWDVPDPAAARDALISSANFRDEFRPGRRLRLEFRLPGEGARVCAVDASIVDAGCDLVGDTRTDAGVRVRFERASPADVADLRRFVERAGGQTQ